MAYRRKDRFYRQAKQEGFRSRAAYKLQELARRLRLFSPGQRVVDLGCAPGGWLQVAARAVGGKGRVIGIDIEEVTPLGFPQVQVLRMDIFDPSTPGRLRELLGGLPDVVLSDMAPHTCGDHDADHARSVELVAAAGRLAAELLRPGGWFVAKVFDGGALSDLLRELAASFDDVRRLRPEATRDGSRELYLSGRRKGGKGGRA